MFQTKVVEKIKTHILCSITFFPENRVTYEIMWKIMVKPDRRHDSIIGRMRLAYLITEARLHTYTHVHNMRYLCFSTANMVKRASLIIYFTPTLPVLFVMAPSVLYADTHVSLEQVSASSGLKEISANTFCIHKESKPTSCTIVFYICSVYTTHQTPSVFNLIL